YYTRIDAPATLEQRTALGKLSPSAVTAADLAGDAITSKITVASGNKAPIGGLKVTANSGWVAARPSGTEEIYKLYAEIFRSDVHMGEIVWEAQKIVKQALGS